MLRDQERASGEEVVIEMLVTEGLKETYQKIKIQKSIYLRLGKRPKD